MYKKKPTLRARDFMTSSKSSGDSYLSRFEQRKPLNQEILDRAMGRILNPMRSL